MFSFGFYNSKNGDRKYNATHFGKLFDGVIQDGVFGTVGNIFRVDPMSEPGLAVTIHPGKAWLAHTWNILDADAVLTFNQVQADRKRTDAIVLEVNASHNSEGYTERTNCIKVIEGNNRAMGSTDLPPTLLQEFDAANIERRIWQYPLAYVTIYGSNYDNRNGSYIFIANKINAQNIQNRINVEGATDDDKYKTWTPLVTGATMNADLRDYLPDWDNLFTEMMAMDAATFNTWFTDLKNTIIIDSSATATLLQLNTKIDNKILYGTGLPPASLEEGQVYFQIEE